MRRRVSPAVRLSESFRSVQGGRRAGVKYSSELSAEAMVVGGIRYAGYSVGECLFSMRVCPADRMRKWYRDYVHLPGPLASGRFFFYKGGNL